MADATIGFIASSVAVFAIMSNPVGWVAGVVIGIQVVSTVYFTARLVQDNLVIDKTK